MAFWLWESSLLVSKSVAGCKLPHPWTHTEHILRQAFGEDWGRVLCFEKQEPVGSGCVAQVYKARAYSPSFAPALVLSVGQQLVPCELNTIF